MRHIVLHYHIFKNAGVTIDTILRKKFGTDWGSIEGEPFAEILGNESLLKYIYEKPGLRAVSSHEARLPQPVEATITFYPLLFIRHPIDRLGSIYSYRRSQSGGTRLANTVARETDLVGFIKWCLSHPVNQPILNVQTGFLSGTLRKGNINTPTANDLNVALRRLNELTFFGLVEFFDESLIRMQEYLYETFGRFDLNYTVQNKSLDRKSTLQERLDEIEYSLGPSLYSELIEKNSLDLELYKNALTLFNKQNLSPKEHFTLRKRIVLEYEEKLSKVTQEKILLKNTLDDIHKSKAWRLIVALRRLRQQLLFENILLMNALRYLKQMYDLYLIRTSHLFDEDWYLAKNPDVAEANVSPLLHYYRHGGFEGCDPGPNFSSGGYLDTYDDVKKARINPLVHYLKYGRKEGRKPKPQRVKIR